MRFQTSSKLPTHLDPRLQRRMLGYVALIAGVLIVVQVFSRSRPPESPNAPVQHPDDLDFSVRDRTRRPLQPDEFIAVGEPSPRDEGHAARRPRKSWEVDPAWMTQVEDNTLGIRSDEADAYFRLLDLARQSSPDDLARVAEPGVQYLNLMTDPSLYRGRPVTLHGEMWRLYEFPATDNDFGLKTLYEAWIFTADSGTHPLRIVCSSPGPGLSPGKSLRTPVRVAGYFFKREGYNTPGGLHVAPTILAGQLEPYVSEQLPPSSDGLAPAMLGVVSAIGLILATTLISFTVNDRFARRLPKRLQVAQGSSTQTWPQADVRSVREQLRDMEEREKDAEWLGTIPAAPSDASRNGQHVADDRPAELPTPLPPTRSQPRS